MPRALNANASTARRHNNRSPFRTNVTVVAVFGIVGLMLGAPYVLGGRDHGRAKEEPAARTRQNGNSPIATLNRLMLLNLQIACRTVSSHGCIISPSRDSDLEWKRRSLLYGSAQRPAAGNKEGSVAGCARTTVAMAQSHKNQTLPVQTATKAGN
jgi:hypothetical protein